MPSAKILGRFCWHELMTTDTQAATAFYTKVIGWKPQKWQEDPSYLMLAGEAGPMAGLMALPEDAKAMGAPPCWMVYIATPDVNVTASQAAALGGRILRPPTDIPKVGRFAVLEDPQGATFAAFTPAAGQQGMPEGKPGLGDFSWHELTTTNWEAAFDFYHQLFGWEKTDSMDMGPGGIYQMYGWKGKTLGGMWNKPASMTMPAHWLAYSIVRDTKAAAEAVKKLGGQVIQGPMEVPGGDWMAQCLDPQGVLFAFSSRPPAAAKPAAKPAAKKVAAKKPAAKKAAAKKPAKKKVAKKKVAKKKVAKKKPARKVARKRGAAKVRRAKAVRRRVAAKRRGAKAAKRGRAKARRKGGAKKRRR